MELHGIKHNLGTFTFARITAQRHIAITFQDKATGQGISQLYPAVFIGILINRSRNQAIDRADFVKGILGGGIGGRNKSKNLITSFHGESGFPTGICRKRSTQ